MESDKRCNWLLLGALAVSVGGQLWQRRKLRQIPGQIEHYSRLTHALITITHETRRLVDVSRIVEVTVAAVARALDVTHCILQLEGLASEPELAGCSCGAARHVDEPLVARDFDMCRAALAGGATELYVLNGDVKQGDPQQPHLTHPLLAAPVVWDEASRCGVLMARADNPARVWAESEGQMLRTAANQVYLAVSQARLYAAIERQAKVDGLTGCLNRCAFDQRLEDELRLAAESGRPLSLVLVDVDHFKDVNDKYGHMVGDEVLGALAKLLLDETGESAAAARYGGEEFALILPHCGVEDAVALAERARARVAGMTVPGVQETITASFGVAAFPLYASSCTSLIKCADEALYRAKDSGRNRVCTP